MYLPENQLDTLYF